MHYITLVPGQAYEYYTLGHDLLQTGVLLHDPLEL